jgi:hypothetical protein
VKKQTEKGNRKQTEKGNRKRTERGKQKTNYVFFLLPPWSVQLSPSDVNKKKSLQHTLISLARTVKEKERRAGVQPLAPVIRKGKRHEKEHEKETENEQKKRTN